MNPDLMPCPKCGSTNIIHAPTITGNPKRPKWTTVCEDCGFSGGTSGTVADADRSWNRRAGAAHDEPAP